MGRNWGRQANEISKSRSTKWAAHKGFPFLLTDSNILMYRRNQRRETKNQDRHRYILMILIDLSRKVNQIKVLQFEPDVISANPLCNKLLI